LTREDDKTSRGFLYLISQTFRPRSVSHSDVRRYLLDTDIASYIINDRFPKLREKLREVPMSDLGVSVITEAELRFGLARKPEFPNVAFIIEDFPVARGNPFMGSNAAKTYANLRADLERKGEITRQNGHDNRSPPLATGSRKFSS